VLFSFGIFDVAPLARLLTGLAISLAVIGLGVMPIMTIEAPFPQLRNTLPFSNRSSRGCCRRGRWIVSSRVLTIWKKNSMLSRAQG